MAIAVTLRLARERGGRTVADVSAEIGVSAATLRRYEAGVLATPDDVLIALAHLYDERRLLEAHPVVRDLIGWRRAG